MVAYPVPGVIIGQIGAVCHISLFQRRQVCLHLFPCDAQQRTEKSAVSGWNRRQSVETRPTHHPMHQGFQVIRRSMRRGNPVCLHLCKRLIAAHPGSQFLRALFHRCPRRRIHVQHCQTHAQRRTEPPAKLRIPVALCATEVVVHMNRRDRDSQTLPQFQQTPQQADTVCATGKRTAHCLPRQYTVQFPELFQHRTGQCISPHCAFPHWRTV